MERINLNVPKEARRRLRQAARRLGRSESEVARDLVLDALARLEREDFYREAAETMTPSARERLIRINQAFERLDAKSR